MCNGDIQSLPLTAHCIPEPYSEKLKCLHHFYTDNYDSNIPMPKNVIIIDIKIIHRCTFGLSIENNGLATVKLTIFSYFPKTMARMSFSE